MKRLDFYFKYAWRSVLRGGQRSFFAILCVSIGVAALVALQSLAVSIKDTLTGDINSLAGGSVTARSCQYASGSQSTTSNSNNTYALTPDTAQYLNDLKAKGQLADWTSVSFNNLQISGYFGFPPSLYTLDPAHFPLYGKVEMVEPSGGNFSSLLAQPNSIIVSKYLWDKNGYKLGQEIDVTAASGISLGGTTTAAKATKLKVVGEVRPGAPGIPTDTGLIFGFGAISQQTAATLLPSPTTSSNCLQVYVKSAPGVNNDGVAQQLKGNYGLFSNVQTAEQLQKSISDVLGYVDMLLSVVGLLAILIGGVGVVNTMLVVIGRRTTEIATVKALGLKTRQTLAIFTIEAMILGVLGSLLGVVVGVGLGFAIKGTAEGLFLRPLTWGLYPGPIIVGLLVGIISAGVFGFLPAYAAGRVRPGVVLRQQSDALPRVGGWATFVIVGLMTVAMGIIAGVLINNILIGIIVAFVTLLLLGLITLGLYLVVWLVGKLPAPFGPSFKMALRSFSRHRGRTATTLLVMVMGLFFITFIVIVADSIKEPLRKAFDTNLGYNVLGISLLSNQTETIQSNLQKNVPGVQKVFASNNTSSQITAVNGKNLPTGQISYVQLSGRSLANGNESISPNGSQPILAGRTFGPTDMDKKVLLVSNTEADRLGVKVGSRVTMELSSSGGGFGRSTNRTQGEPQDFEVIGITGKGNSTFQFERDWVAPFRVVADAGSSFSILYMLVDRNSMKDTLTKVQGLLPGGFVFDLGDLIDTFTRLLDQFLAFPLLLSLLSLFSGAILIANNVALAMLERRTEIGVLKAIGAKRRRVFSILLWESGLVGFLGGLIGIGVGIGFAFLIPVISAATSRNGSSSSQFSISWSPLNALLLLALGIGLAMVATLISAWGAIQEKPLVVLRYE